MDPDRFQEEKTRGITIDLGFAHLQDEGGNTLAFVDVPGHERFVHNMLAGASGLDAVLLVVAADEGVMPQTREHLAICNLLGIQTGLIVLTRIDKVEDPDLVELCAEEVRELVQETFLREAPVHHVSALSGQGLPELREALFQLAPQPRHPEAPFRLAVDRSFAAKGFGTVVTGTAGAGTLRIDEELMQYPQQRLARIRGMQVHGVAAAKVVAGQRTALNLSTLHHKEIQRGDQLALPGSLLNSFMLNVELQVLEDAARPLQTRQRVRVYLGTREVLGRVVLLEQPQLTPGAQGLCQLRLEAPVSSRFGDRFIVRSYSPVQTIGGGRVLDPAPAKSRRVMHELAQRLEGLRGEDEAQRVEDTVFLQAMRGVAQEELAARSGLSIKRAEKLLQWLQSKQRLVCLDAQEQRWWHPEHLRRLGHYVLRIVQGHHARFPERAGMTRPELAGKLALVLQQESRVDALLKLLVREGTLLRNEDQTYADPEHQPETGTDQEALLSRCEELLRQGGFQPLRRTHLLEALELDEKAGVALLKHGSHHRRLIRIAEDLFYLPEVLEQIAQHLREHFSRAQTLSVIEFKDLLGISRKHAVELLEYFDLQRLTVRHENQRTAGMLNAEPTLHDG